MRFSYLLILCVWSTAVMSPTLYAGSLECKGKIISPGDTQEQVLEACGSPTSRQGADWVYETPGSLPMVVTFQGGVVAFIRDVEPEDTPGASPLGAHP